MVRKQYIQFPAFLVNQAEQNKRSQWEERRGKNIGLLACVDDLIFKGAAPIIYNYMNIHLILSVINE